MTPAQIEAAKALGSCSFLPGSYEKRFARDMKAIATEQPEKPLTEKQLVFLEKMLHRYRKQLGGLRHYRAVHGEKLLEQFTELFSPKPDQGSVVLGGQDRKPEPGSVVLGGSDRPS